MQASISRFFAPKPKIEPPSGHGSTSSGISASIDLTDESTPASVSESSVLERLRAAEPDMVRSHKFNMALDAHAATRRARTPHSSDDAASSSTLSVPPGVKLTPLEGQVVEIKRRYPDCLLMVHVAYKLRFFGQDAITAGKVLSIWTHRDNAFMVASVPTFRVYVHLRRLVQAGHKVALVRQTEIAAVRSAKGKGKGRGGLFKRDVVAIFTPATVVDDADPTFADLLLQGRPQTITDGNGEGAAAAGGNVNESAEGGDEEALAEAGAVGSDESAAGDDAWLAAIVEYVDLRSSLVSAPRPATTEVAVVAVDICSHRVRVFSFTCEDTSRQELGECIGNPDPYPNRTPNLNPNPHP